MFISNIFIPEAGLLTVTKVNVSDDLKYAKVFLSFLENKLTVQEVMTIVESKNNLIRKYISTKVTIKYLPQLKYYYDDTFSHVERIENLIEKIHKYD